MKRILSFPGAQDGGEVDPGLHPTDHDAMHFAVAPNGLAAPPSVPAPPTSLPAPPTSLTAPASAQNHTPKRRGAPIKSLRQRVERLNDPFLVLTMEIDEHGNTIEV